MTYSNGNTYEGEWKEGIKSGTGKMTWKEKKEEYEGSWLNGKPNGYGTYIWRINALRLV